MTKQIKNKRGCGKLRNLKDFYQEVFSTWKGGILVFPPSDPRPAMFLSRTLWQVSGASVAQGSETTAGPPWHQRHCLVGLASTYRDHWLLERFQADST